MLNTPKTIAECAALALHIREWQDQGQDANVEEGLEVLTHALFDLASKPLLPEPGSPAAKLWEKFDRQQPRAHRFS